MAGNRWPPEEHDLFPARGPPWAASAADMVSDDDRSVAADSWSIKSDYGSTLDDEQRHVDAAEVLSGCNFPAVASDYSSDKDVPDANEVETSMLGLQSYWDATYAEDLANFHERGHAGEVWFGVEVMDILVDWIKNLCSNTSQGLNADDSSNNKAESSDINKELSSFSVLDIGTGNGMLLQELAKQGFADLTGTDYSQAAIDLAQKLAARDGFSYIKFLIDDVLETKLDRKYQLVTDKGVLDAIGMHPEGPAKRRMYWESLSNLVAQGGILVITLCDTTKDDLLKEVEAFNLRKFRSDGTNEEPGIKPATFQYLDHIQSYPSMIYGGAEGSHVATIAFIRK